ncbi:MAG: phospholipase D-like domain-containing protein [Candidatus Bathyarchaeota archaeon]|nr:phospholipase D-like domain-containing protein [Candidatus Bathyarchaeota archaeon]
MKTYSGSTAGSNIEPVLWNARESIWIISPWLGKDYAKRLALLSQKGIEVRIVTSNVDYNSESLEVFQASENPNLILLVLDKEKVGFIHSKIYIVDKAHAISGSANLTYSGLNSNVESLSIAENKEEVQQIEMDFMRIWMNFERKSMSNEELSVEIPHSIMDALPLSINYVNIDYPNIKGKELVYHPYYFFEFSFRASAGKSPPVLFENSGFVMLDGVTRQIVKDYRLFEEVKNHPIEDYLLKTENKYLLRIHEPKIRDFREAKELVLDHIIKVNTKHYKQHYGSRSYDRIFVPYRRIIRFIKSGFVKLPLWYIERHEPDGRKHQDIVFGASGKKWKELLYCPECQKKIWISQATKCKMCGKQLCHDCINEVGLIFKKKLCSSCLPKTR